MAMKKKFLPLLMAGMVVVGTTGVASATSSNSQTIEGNAGDASLGAQVTVSGTVANNQGIAPEGKLNVELPTKMTFAVNKDGQFSGGSYNVRNNSKDGIDVYVSEFTQKSGDIELVAQASEATSRGQVHLKLKGKAGEVTLRPNEVQETKLVNVAGGGGIGTINLNGTAGKETSDKDSTGATGEYNMVFKIKKAS
nr:hypothetical protein [uncultured Romboutsia sp.]